MIKFQLVQGRCDLIDSYSEGDQITVEFDLRGREWNDKYFTNLNAWRIVKDEGGNDASATEEPSHPLPEGFDDEIPF